jgi:hypothetical protein
MRLMNEPQRGLRRVRVPVRDDVGEVINEGTNIGAADKNIYRVAVHFPLTGEVVYYDKNRVTTLED